MDLADVSIVIISQGREESLMRTLTYWSSQSVKVVVVHDSKKPLDISKNAVNLTYRIHHGSYGERCAIVPELLKTKYSILSSDDELYIPSALHAMKLVMDNDETIASVGGRTIAIGKYASLVTATNPYQNMYGYVNDAESPYSRVCGHYDKDHGNRIGGIYRLLKTEHMKNMLDIFGAVSKVTTPYIYEVTAEILINSMGSGVYLSNVYWIRNWINEPVQNRNWNRNLQFTSWAKNATYDDEVSEWKQTLSRELQLTKQEIEDVLQRIIAVLKPSEESASKGKNRWRLLLSESMKYKIRKSFFPSTLPFSLEDTLEKMKINGAKFDISEIKEAVETLLR
jgi:hypothetical protein